MEVLIYLNTCSLIYKDRILSGLFIYLQKKTCPGLFLLKL